MILGTRQAIYLERIKILGKQLGGHKLDCEFKRKLGLKRT
jgi:hypothetical protein